MKKIFHILLTLTLLVACRSELTKECALDILKNREEFTKQFYVPFHIGREVLSGENHKNPEAYINEHLGKLINAGVVQAKITESNSWRSVLEISLTEKAKTMQDATRSDKTCVYVQGCNLVVISVDSLVTVTPDEVMEVSYTFQSKDITPFGEHFQLVDGKLYHDKLLFRRAGSGWEVDSFN